MYIFRNIKHQKKIPSEILREFEENLLFLCIDLTDNSLPVLVNIHTHADCINHHCQLITHRQIAVAILTRPVVWIAIAVRAHPNGILLGADILPRTIWTSSRRQRCRPAYGASTTPCVIRCDASAHCRSRRSKTTSIHACRPYVTATTGIKSGASYNHRTGGVHGRHRNPC